MSTYTVFVRCDGCHQVLPPLWIDVRELQAQPLLPQAAILTRIEAHAPTCPLRDRPTGDPE